MGSICLFNRYMLEYEWWINCNCSAWYCWDCSFLCLLMNKWSRRNCNSFTYLPIYIFTDSKTSSSRWNGGRNGSPCWDPRFSIHRKFTVNASNSFVSKHWLLFSVIISVHNKLEVAMKWGILSSCNKLSTI